MQAVGGAKPAPEWAALEACIAVPPGRAQHCETLGLEQQAPGRPGRSVCRQLTIHEQQRPPGKTSAGDGRGERFYWCIMQVGFEELSAWGRCVVERTEPAFEVPAPGSQLPAPETCQPDLPQLEIRRLRQGDTEARILPRGEREVG